MPSSKIRRFAHFEARLRRRRTYLQFNSNKIVPNITKEIKLQRQDEETVSYSDYELTPTPVTLNRTREGAYLGSKPTRFEIVT
ncbi:hypothetical protein EVAR_64334_1 [Eumeta japonica]|uniref:Uncharacterized protein n=1 Tax=Eumeta variegata TaxID=151549 RepID=A0A4C1ZEI0_EUMVA|nr:hypothetical protein EVAR_64334_1 [Eumeta japonica]